MQADEIKNIEKQAADAKMMTQVTTRTTNVHGEALNITTMNPHE